MRLGSFDARLIGIAVAVALSLVAAPTARAVEPGFDLFETDPQNTQFAFQDEFTIPAGFFDAGSAAFQGTVPFGGVPILTFQGRDIGDADTVVQRPLAANLTPPFPATATIPIQIVMLSLQSVQPIQVKVGATMQQWNVQVQLSPTRPSQGQMTISQADPQGGTLNSQLLVVPRFTFTRLSDGTTKTLDVGQLPFNPQSVQDLVLQSSNVPWRAGCTPPALTVPGLNNGFCPGLTVNGFKQPNIELSRLAKHGVLPAQPQLEHFKCYAIRPRRRFKQRRAQLVDQFGAGSARVLKPLALCAPVRKNRERFTNRSAHLQCYAIRQTPAFRGRIVAVRNQFGPDVLKVVRPTSLCAPSLKLRGSRRKPPSLPREAQIDHFACYRVSSQAKARHSQVSLSDQFGREHVRVLRPVNLCAPVQKNGARVQHPVRHLVCYEIKDLGRRKFRPRAVRVANQFGAQVVTVVKPRLLCVPSVKVVL